jgi:metal-sulfur cluster biosynthetic enzyme
MPDLLDRIDAALDAIYDPCSMAVSAPLSIRDMGLVLERRVDDDGRAFIRLCVTGPSCMLVGSIVRGVEEQVGAVPGVSGVQVTIDAGHMWTEDDMSARGRATMADARRLSRARFPVAPRQWQRGAPAGAGGQHRGPAPIAIRRRP